MTHHEMKWYFFPQTEQSIAIHQSMQTKKTKPMQSLIKNHNKYSTPKRANQIHPGTPTLLICVLELPHLGHFLFNDIA